MAYVVALIHGCPGAYGLSFPDYPGATTGGEAIGAAIAKAQDVLSGHIEALNDMGTSIPEPRELDDLKADPAFAEDFADVVVVTLVQMDLPGRAKRFTISMDERLMDRIDACASASGETRSGYLAAAARRRMAEEPGGTSRRG